MSETEPIALELEQLQDFEFRLRFLHPPAGELLTDEPAPLGRGVGPNPALLLAGAVGNCLAASLLFALRKFRNEPGRLRAEVRAERARNAEGRWRIVRIAVRLFLAESGESIAHRERILEQFERFCIVTESVRSGIPVEVQVLDGEGALLHQSQAGGGHG
jgi:uncharacterized OsmC-like protein